MGNPEMSKDMPLIIRIAMFLAVVITVTFVMAVFFMLAGRNAQAATLVAIAQGMSAAAS